MSQSSEESAAEAGWW